MSPPVREQERLSVRRRLIDGSATDVIGWLQSVNDDSLVLRLDPQQNATIERASVIAARRVPPARGGRDPVRFSAEEVERIALPAWVDHRQPLGEWTLRVAEGFSRRANSCLAIGDPGLDEDQAAEQVIDFYRGHDQLPLVQAIADDPADRALRRLGWVSGGPDTDLMVVRLGTLIGDHREPATPVELDEDLPDAWFAALLAQRGLGELTPRVEAASRRVLAGPEPVVFAGIAAEANENAAGHNGKRAAPRAMGRGQLSQGWLGLTAIWTRPDERRRGWAVDVMMAIARWAALRGARNAYLQVAHDNTAAQSLYARLGFVHHHGYRYLKPPT